MTFRIPKALENHVAVARVFGGETQGFDYKYDIELRPGWQFTRGRLEGCYSGRFNSVKDFEYANPQHRS